MLQLIPSDRATAIQSLQHPWLYMNGIDWRSGLPDSMLEIVEQLITDDISGAPTETVVSGSEDADS